MAIGGVGRARIAGSESPSQARGVVQADAGRRSKPFVTGDTVLQTSPPSIFTPEPPEAALEQCAERSFVGATHTDLGRATAGGPIDPSAPGFAELVRTDLEALHDQGTTDVRIWANPRNATNDNFEWDPGDADHRELMSQRIDVIADEAAKLGMRVTVDLVDAHDAKGITGLREQFELQFRTSLALVEANAEHGNIDWSPGNELGLAGSASEAELGEFAGAVAEWAGEIRHRMGANQRVVVELTPGALGYHPASVPAEADPDHAGTPDADWVSADEVRGAMQRIARNVDAISIHYYPTTGPDRLVDDPAAGDFSSSDYQSLLAWRDAAAAEGKGFVIGEFGFSRDAFAARSGVPAAEIDPGAYAQLVEAWLVHFREIGVEQVRLWQFGKDEVGHIDANSLDSLGDHADETASVAELLRREGFLAGVPSEPCR